jgi:hypothetical protein
VIAFLQEITQGPDALPVADRVAAFDNDGTLACKKPHTALAGFLLDRVAAAGSAPPEVGSGHDVLRELGVLRFALVIHHDDAVREYAYDDQQILDAAAEGGWTVLSMRDDFARLWPADLADLYAGQYVVLPAALLVPR